MFKNMKLQTKLLTIGILLTVIPLLAVSIIVYRQNNVMVNVSDVENTKSAYSNLDNIADGVYSLCETQNELIQENLIHSLNTAREVLTNSGPVSFSEESVSWNATNQYSKTSSRVELPKMARPKFQHAGFFRCC